MMNRDCVSLHIFFITSFILGSLTAIQQPKIVNVEETEQKVASQEWNLNDVKKRKKRARFSFLDDNFVFKSIKTKDIDYQRRKIVCSAILDGKKSAVTFLLEQEQDLLHVFWTVVFVIDDVKKSKDFINPIYNAELNDFWFKPMLGLKKSILFQIFYEFVGIYTIYLDGPKIIDQKCHSCEEMITSQKDANLIVSAHYRLSNGSILCKKCGFHLFATKAARNILYVNSWKVLKCHT
ncbi:MAG: hypothetical protein WCW33_02710 [Candidatus Babeliales bacterium]